MTKIAEAEIECIAFVFDAKTFVTSGAERDDGEWSSDTRQQIASIKKNHPELSEWGDLAIGSAWCGYSQDFMLVSWCEWLTDRRDELFLCYCYYQQLHGYWSLGFEEDEIAKYDGWRNIAIATLCK